MCRGGHLFTGIAAAIYPPAFQSKPQAQLTTFTQWMNATQKEREQGVQGCLDRIREMDSFIQAWLQVSPSKPTGTGKPSEIPFGAKDIIETKGLAMEYGSPIYKGRIGTTDAAIVAAGIVPIALGTQTRGSPLRPGPFCGVTGFKPTYGWSSSFCNSPTREPRQ